METPQIREELHEYINCGDEKLLRLLYAVASEYSNHDDQEYEFSAEDIALFEERSLSYERGETKAYDWETVKQMITGKK